MFFLERASGTNMTTSPIYEPIVHISDDYFRWPKAGLSSHDDIGGQGIIQTRRMAQNTTDSDAIQPDSNLPEANESRIMHDPSCLQ
jgi:hypothetical protein